MPDNETLHNRVVEALKQVIDPETGTDVIRMRLVLELQIHDDGIAEYIFRPSSPLCPIALTLVMQIIEAVKSVDGITDQKVTVVDYTGSDELNAILATLPLSKQT